MIFQHSQCFQCFQCSKKRGTPLKIPPHCERSSHQHTAQGSAQVPQGRNSTAGATAQCRGSAQTPQREKQHGRGDSTAQGSAQVPQKGETGTVQGERTSSTRVKQHGRGDSTVQKSAQAPQDGKSDSSGKQERGRQALRSCDFGGHCFGSLLLSYHSALQGMR